MDHISPHGLVIAILQLGFVLFLLWLQHRWSDKRLVRGSPVDWRVPIGVAAVLVGEYAILRVQPARMGGDPWHYTLGLFDGVTALGLVMVFVWHWRRPEAS